MNYEIANEILTFHLDNPKRVEKTTATQSFVGTGLTQKQISVLAECMVKKFRGAALGTQQGVTTQFLRPLCAYFLSTKIAWPITSTDWQITMYRFFQFYLADTKWSQARTSLRMREWQTRVSGLLEYLKEEEVIPLDVLIPSVDQRKIKSIATDQHLLGEFSLKLSDLSDPPKKLLVDIGFGMTDANYLDAVEKKCRNLVNLIQNTCQKHWDGLMKDGATGRKLAETVTDEEIEREIESNRFGIYSEQRHGLLLYASPLHPQGHNWALAVTRQKISTGANINCASVVALRNSPFFRKDSFGHKKDSFDNLADLTTLTGEQWQKLQIPSRFYRFAGLLSNIDAAAACCLLIIEHPQFTPESLRDARLLNVHGKSYLLLTDNSANSILSVDKPRAGERKFVVLTERSQTLVREILKWTGPVRDVLKRAGDKTWRYLFLGVTQRSGKSGILGVIEGKAIYLNGGQSTIGLTTLHPELLQNGLEKGSFDYRRLRNTLGVIRWFETGSILEMSRRLGNTRKVALEHYLPPALLHAWNTRIIRRFQNTLIVLAAYDEPYLLEVTDFSNMADLQHFVAQLIVDYPKNSSPLAEKVQKRLVTEDHLTVSEKSMPGLLSIRLSPKSLSTLYSYSHLAQRILSRDELDKVDAGSGLAPRQFVDMATLLHHAAESECIHASLKEALDVPLLKQVHGEALSLQRAMDAKFAQMAIKHRWSESV